MRRFLAPVAILALLAAPATAFAKDRKDKDDDEEIEEEEPIDESAFKDAGEPDEEPIKRLEEDDGEPPADEPKDDEDFTETEEDDLDFRDEEDAPETVKPRGPGEDTAELYRAMQKKVKEMSPDEEMVQWEAYLQKYPKSLFKDRIEARMEELSAELFGERVPGSDRGAKTEDLAKREITFAQPVQFFGVDPRSHISVSAELGIPNHFNPRVDVEYAILREASAHAAFYYDGPAWSFVIDAGGKYSLIKSVRTGFLLTAMLDAKIYTVPTSFAMRPAIGAGKRFDFLEGLDVQAQLATDLELRDPFAARYFGGVSATLRANKTVSAFVESSMNFKYLGAPEIREPFQFMVATFGLKFRAAKGHDEQDQDGRVDLGLAANVPYSYKYWGLYSGAVTIGGDYYLGPEGMNW
ncbi:MAG: hypothetical protein ACOZNI_33035 [Myxococcota bacterium]